MNSKFKAREHISGVPELTPSAALLFETMTEQLKQVFRLYGARPLITGAFEHIHILRAKAGATGKEIYSVGRIHDDPTMVSEKYGLRFDQTVPFARYVAANQEDLSFPFLRYAVGPVWRGERPQRGRYREFVQADLDVVERSHLPPAADAEMIAAMAQALQAIRAPRFIIGINNRKVLDALFRVGGVAADNVAAILHEFDALSKPSVGVAGATAAMVACGCPELFARAVCQFSITSRSDAETFNFLEEVGPNDGGLKSGVDELRHVIEIVRALGIPHELAHVDLSIVRGLDYYTGTVFEAKLVEYPMVGSIASGGRYDNLVSDLTGAVDARHPFPGVGFSIGLTRLFLVLADLGELALAEPSTASALVLCRDESQLAANYHITGQLRAMGIAAVAYPAKRDVHLQLRYARNNRIPFLVDTTNFETSGSVTVEDLRNQSLPKHQVLGTELGSWLLTNGS